MTQFPYSFYLQFYNVPTTLHELPNITVMMELEALYADIVLVNNTGTMFSI